MPRFPFDFTQLPTPCLMGILNITPDSFSDGNQFFDPANAIAHGKSLAQAGATILDLGAEASSFFRPTVTPTAPTEQIRRLEQVIPTLAQLPNIHLSIDTRSAEVARHALTAGASMINDISAGTYDPRLLPTVAAHDAAIILMHISPGYPKTPDADDPAIVETVWAYLTARVDAAMAAGIPRTRIAIDPGIGFGKTMPDNWRLALGCHHFLTLGLPIVLGASRKRFLETPPPAAQAKVWQTLLTAMELLTTAADHPRDLASAALTRLAANDGIAIHRVHNVSLARRALNR
jgi:dihydropteroate synthase